jgi:hypothetical protein
VPVLRGPIEAKKLSVFNPALHPTHPLKAMYLTNTTNQFLAQGPLTVYEDGTATGQARIADVKPNDNRLIAYALDLDVPVRTTHTPTQRTPVSRKLVKGELRTVARLKDVAKYEVENRGKQPATVWLTHVVRPEWKLIAPAKVIEKTPDLYRFEVIVAPGEKATVEVIEERDETTTAAVWKMSAAVLDELTKEAITPPAVKAALVKARAVEVDRDAADTAVRDEEERIKEIVDEQNRLRANLMTLPKESDAYKKYLKKFDEQETEIDARRPKVKELAKLRAKLAKDLTEMTKTLDAE